MKPSRKIAVWLLAATLVMSASVGGFYLGLGAITTTDYYLDTPLPIADYYIGVYSNGSYFAINGSNWDNFLVSTNFTDVMSTCLAALPTLGGHIHMGSGTFDGQISIPNVGTSSTYSGRNIRITGTARHGTRIRATSICNNEGIINSSQSDWVSGGTFVTLENLRISANSNGADWAIRLGFQKVFLEHIRIDGTFTGSSEIGVYYGGSGADATPSYITDVEFRAIGATRAFDLWDENAVIGALQINLVTGDLTSGIRLQGTAFSMDRIGCYMGDGRSMTGDLLELDAVEQCYVGAMYLTDSATPSAFPTVFDVDSNSQLVVNHFFTSNGYLADIFSGATTQANTMILGSFNAESVFQVYTSVTNGTFKAHGFGITPDGATVAGTIATDIISVLSLNSTHIELGVIEDDGTTGTSQTVYVHYKP